MTTAWISVAKGIGIAAVVAGHAWPDTSLVSRLIFMFHMPLFFFISGYLFRPRSDGLSYAIDKAHSLLVPYAVFLALLLPLQYVLQPGFADAAYFSPIKVLAKAVFGGRALYGWTGVFWFITCLYLTQVLVNFLLNKMKASWVGVLMAVFMACAYVNSAVSPGVLVPWSANVVLMAAPIFFAGYIAKKQAVKMPLGGCALVSGVGVVLVAIGFPVELNMKYVNYGWPIASVVISLATVWCVLRLSEVVATRRVMCAPLMKLGEASLVIMFLHQPIQFFMQENLGIESNLARLAVATALPYLVYLGFQRFEFTRRFFLGQRPSRHKLAPA